jgi:hypothetical protein
MTERPQLLLVSAKEVYLMKAFPSKERVRNIILILLLMGLVFSSLCLNNWQPSSFSTSNTYRLSIRTDAQLFNATFLIPLPVRNGIPAVGFLNLTESMFEQGEYHASFIQVNGDPYLKLTAEMVSTNPEYKVDYADTNLRVEYTRSGYRTEYKNAPDYPFWIDTRDPQRNETVFLPKNNVTILEPTEPTYSTGSGIRYNPILMRYQTKVYAEYQTLTDSSVSIFASIEGQNEWVEEFDAWRGNSYSDYFEESFNGPTRGWHLVTGELKSGGGKYLDGTY